MIKEVFSRSLNYLKKHDQLEDPDPAAGAVLQQLVKKYILGYFLFLSKISLERKKVYFYPEKKTLLERRRAKNF